jgi:galactose mutarotase-like enzyme
VSIEGMRCKDMQYELKNDFLTVKVSSVGAELQSIRDSGNLEYIWQSDEDIWPRQAPILFPIVGRLKNDHYYVDNKEYKMTLHGFARDEEFTLVSNEESKLVLKLTDNEFSHKIYPYKFELDVIYKLKEKELSVSYVVKNIDNKETLYFSIGAHPGFAVPFQKELKYSDFEIIFNPQKNRKMIPMKDHYADINNKYDVSNQNFQLSREKFKDDALVYELDGPTNIAIESNSIKKKIIFNTGNAKYVGLWSTYPKNGEFVCIEPWWGIDDTLDSDNQYEHKEGINKLVPEESFKAYFSMKIV